MITAGLPAGYTLRRPAATDLDAVHAVVAADEIAACGRVFTTKDDVAADWRLPRFDAEHDAWVVVAAGGDLVGYAWVGASEPDVLIDGDLNAHPDEYASGVEEYLLKLIEERAAEMARKAPPDAHPSLAVWCEQREQRRIETFARHGFAKAREFCNMDITLDDSLPEPRWPEGIVAHEFVRGRDDERVHASIEDAFAEHFRPFRESLDDWRERVFGYPGFDVDLWFVAWDGEQVAGTVLAIEEDDRGIIRELAVGKPWRNRGLGMALLLQAFKALRDRGWMIVGLGVDAANTTGATRLYERAGMRETHRFSVFTKDLPARA